MTLPNVQQNRALIRKEQPADQIQFSDRSALCYEKTARRTSSISFTWKRILSDLCKRSTSGAITLSLLEHTIVAKLDQFALLIIAANEPCLAQKQDMEFTLKRSHATTLDESKMKVFRELLSFRHRHEYQSILPRSQGSCVAFISVVRE